MLGQWLVPASSPRADPQQHGQVGVLTPREPVGVAG